MLRLVPAHRDHFLGAGVLESERRVIRREAEPAAPIPRQLEALCPCDLLEFPARYSHPIDFSGGKGADKVKEMAVMGPTWVPTIPSTSFDHFELLKSKSFSPLESESKAARYLPSGDQRGENIPSESGSVAI